MGNFQYDAAKFCSAESSVADANTMCSAVISDMNSLVSILAALEIPFSTAGLFETMQPNLQTLLEGLHSAKSNIIANDDTFAFNYAQETMKNMSAKENLSSADMELIDYANDTYYDELYNNLYENFDNLNSEQRKAYEELHYYKNKYPDMTINDARNLESSAQSHFPDMDKDEAVKLEQSQNAFIEDYNNAILSQDNTVISETLEKHKDTILAIYEANPNNGLISAEFYYQTKGDWDSYANLILKTYEEDNVNSRNNPDAERRITYLEANKWQKRKDEAAKLGISINELNTMAENGIKEYQEINKSFASKDKVTDADLIAAKDALDKIPKSYLTPELKNVNKNYEIEIKLYPVKEEFNKLNQKIQNGEVSSKDYENVIKQINDLPDSYLYSDWQDIGKQLQKEKEYTSDMEAYEEAINTRDSEFGWFGFNQKEKDAEAEIERLEKKWGLEHNADGFEKFCDDPLGYSGATAGTFLLSVGEGLYGVAEGIVDGTIQVGGGLISLGVSLYDEDAGESMQDWIKKTVKKDHAAEVYDSVVNTLGIDHDIAYGPAHDVGNFVGEAVGTIGLQFVPGGKAVMVAAHALKGAGESAEKAYNKNPDASFNQVLAHSVVSGAIEGMFSNVLYGKTNVAPKGIAPNMTKNIDTFAKSLHTSTSVAKVGLAGSKEYLKEMSSTIVDGEMDWGGATMNAGRAMLIQGVNEVIVGGVKSTKGTVATKNTNTAAAKAKMEKLVARKDAAVNSQTHGTNPMGDFLGNKSGFSEKAIKNMDKGIKKCQDIIAKNELKLHEKVIDKVACKPGTIAWDWQTKLNKKVYDEVGKAVQDLITGKEG